MAGDSPLGKPAVRGIAAYQKVMSGGAGSPPEEKVKNLPKRKTPAPVFPSEEGLLKTGRPSKYRRAAQFMMLVGSEEASRILKRLDPEQVAAISKEIVSIKSISPLEAEAVMKEFRYLLSPAYGYSGSSAGGIEEARRLLYAAFGPEKGEALLVKAVPGAAENPFDFLADFSGEQLSLLFRDESPAACALVFSRLPSKLSAAVLANASPERKMEIVRRIARIKEISPEVINRTAAALREKARFFGRSDGTGGEIDGKGVLAAILKHSDMAFGGRLLEELEEEDPALSREMKNRLYTLEDVCGAADRPIQAKLRSMGDREIALLLRGASEPFEKKIIGNLSSARAARVREESEIAGPVPKAETDAVVKDFLSWFRSSREEGRILMLSGEDELV